MAKLISTRQVLALLRSKMGSEVRLGKLERVVLELERDERLPGREGREAWASPDDVDLVEGEMRRMRTGWYQRRNVRGDFEAWVDWGDGERYLLRLPWERTWSIEKGEETLNVPNVVGTWEWPTARLTGCLMLATDEGGKPVYHWMSAERFDEDEKRLLTEQWMTGAKSRAS
jgi:hypothetical protein